MALFSRPSARTFTIVVPSRSLRTQASTVGRPHGSFEPHAPRIRSSKKSSSPTEKPITQYRSKYFDPSSKNTKADGKVLLEPHILSARLKKLCDGGQIDTAVAMLKNSPLDAQNVPVWNTLIWECLKAERFRLAYELYTDMKRRGHRPNTRTFQTLMNGLSRIEDWESHTKQLVHAHSIHQAFMRHTDAVKKHDSSSAELSLTPVAAYIKILGAVGLHQEIFDVFYSLDTEGPCAPDHVLLTAMFQALSLKPNTDTGDFIQNAATAKLLWNLTLKASRRSKFQIDGFLVSSAILALARGRAVDQDFAFDLVEKYFGLVAPDGTNGIDASATSKETKDTSTIPLQPQSFAAILTLCRNSSRPLHAINFFGAVLQRPESRGGPSIIDRAHVEQVLQSLIAVDIPSSSEKALELVEWMLAQEIKLPSSVATKIRPTYTTYNLLVSQICRLENNWRVAAKAFDLMTGYHCHDFMDGMEESRPRLDHRSFGKNIPPTAEILSSMMRIAIGSQNRANIRQALRLIHHVGIQSLMQPSHALESRKASKEKHFYVSKLAQGVLEGIEILYSSDTPSDRPRDHDILRWKSLRAEVKEILSRREAERDFIPSIRQKPVRNSDDGRGQMKRLSRSS
ncbi:pentatricopeptide repeat-containing protein [Lentinula raphanica]|nr:pentatricopeptide repeat-containing protein [Lentinula raphanica]